MQIPPFVKEYLAQHGIPILIAIVLLLVILYFAGVFSKKKVIESNVVTSNVMMTGNVETSNAMMTGNVAVATIQVSSLPTDDTYHIILANDFGGNDTSRAQNSNVESCKKMCDEDSNCIAFSLNNDTKMCNMKSQFPNNVLNPSKSYVTYIKKSAQNYPESLTSYVQNFQVTKFGDLVADNSELEPEPTGSNFNECMGKCKEDVNCQGFSFNAQDGKCVVRSTNVQLSANYLDASKFQYYQKVLATAPASAPAQAQAPTQATDPTPASPAPAPATASTAVTNPTAPSPEAEMEDEDDEEEEEIAPEEVEIAPETKPFANITTPNGFIVREVGNIVEPDVKTKMLGISKTLDECGQLCIEKDNCAGFVYDNKNSKCRYRTPEQIGENPVYSKKNKNKTRQFYVKGIDIE